MLHVVDDRGLVDGVGHGLPELRVSEPLQLLGRDVGLAGVGVLAGVHVEYEECRPKRGTSPVYREVSFFLQRLELCVLLAQNSVGVRLARQELCKLGFQVRDDDVDDLIQVRQAVASVVL